MLALYRVNGEEHESYYRVLLCDHGVVGCTWSRDLSRRV